MKLKPILTALLLGLLAQACKTLPGNQYAEGLISQNLNWDGYERSYLLHLPPQEKQQASMGVLFHLHGGGGNAKGTPALTFGRFNELANRDGFIVVYPNAYQKNWNDGRKADHVPAWKLDMDDVGFITEIVNRLKQAYPINEDKIFTTGMSNGGFMSARLLCDRADIFRGAAILTATLSEAYLPQCKPSHSAGILVMNGTDDKLVPYDGGQIRVLGRPRGTILSTDRFINFWREHNRCLDKMPSRDLPDKADDGTKISVQEYTNCDTEAALVLYTVHGGGHTWPGGKEYLGEGLIGKTSKDIVAADVIWEFFQSL